MSKSFLRLIMAVSLCLSVGLTACGDPDDNNTSNNGGECTENADCGDNQICDADGMCVADTTCETNSDCAEGEVCDDSGMCVADNQCEMDSDCAAGEVCNNGTCETDGGCTQDSQCGAGEFCTDAGECDDGQCANVSPGEECDPNGDPAGNLTACVQIGEEGTAVCADSCTPPAQGEADPCPAQSECLGVGQGAGACIATQCSLGLGECGAGAGCQPISRDTNLCIATGSGAAGDDCASQFTDISSTRCGEGLFCDLFYTGVCRTPCQNDDACDSGTNTCVGDGNSDIYSNAEGFCGEGCEPFGDRGTCGDGAGCAPLTADVGLCEAAGDIELYGACQSTACEADDDCPTGVTCNQNAGSCDYGTQCQGDARCISLTGATDAGDDAEARCLPACDPTAENPDETCPAANPQSFVRFQHISGAANAAGVTSVDVYVDGIALVTDVAFPSTPIASLPFFAVAPGQHTVEIYTAGADTTTESPVLSQDIDLAVNAQMTYVVADAPDGSGGKEPGIQSFETPRGVATASDAVKLRMFHGIPNLPADVDVFIVEEGTDVADRANDSIPDPLVSGLAYGDVSSFPDGQGGTMPFAELPGGSPVYNAYITTTGGDPTDASAVLGEVTGLTAPNGSILTIAAVEDASTAGDLISIPLPYASEDESRVLGGFCFDLSGPDQDASPRTGVCFEECGGAANYAQGICTANSEGDTCAPFQYSSVCWPSEGNAVGDSCDPTAVNSCASGAYCRGDGAGNGVCKELCARVDPSDNTDLACSTAGESCAPIPYGPYDVGECRQECDPANNPDSSCPADLQQCLPVWTDDNFDPATNYCNQSGDTAVGEQCEGGTQNNCVPSALCTQGPTDNNPTCRTACEMLQDDTGCGDSEVCYPNFSGGSSSIGTCVDEDPDLSGIPSLGQCPLNKAGSPCGDGSICIGIGQGQAACLQFCDVETDTGCTGEQVCDPAGPLFGLTNYDEADVDIPYTLGVCFPPQ